MILAVFFYYFAFQIRIRICIMKWIRIREAEIERIRNTARIYKKASHPLHFDLLLNLVSSRAFFVLSPFEILLKLHSANC